jgi:predicted nucleotidyltransferase component of viral defense system
VQVCALEDILAEKLRALLQQPIRHRNRRQDVYDIARMTRIHNDLLDRRKIGDYLMRKAAARNVPVHRQAFDDEIKRLASYEYEQLFDRLDPDFIPFDEAWSAIVQLVSQLAIPERPT